MVEATFKPLFIAGVEGYKNTADYTYITLKWHVCNPMLTHMCNPM